MVLTRRLAPALTYIHGIRYVYTAIVHIQHFDILELTVVCVPTYIVHVQIETCSLWLKYLPTSVLFGCNMITYYALDVRCRVTFYTVVVKIELICSHDLMSNYHYCKEARTMAFTSGRS